MERKGLHPLRETSNGSEKVCLLWKKKMLSTVNTNALELPVINFKSIWYINPQLDTSVFCE